MPIEYTGAGGVAQNYGPRLSPLLKPEPVPAKESTAGNRTELEINFTFDNLPNPTAASANDARELSIPANAFIESVREYVVENWAGGTSLAIDSRVPATGAVASAGGFITAAQNTTAAMNPGAWITGSGVLVGATVGTAPVKVGATAVGTFTSGRSRIVITYLVAQG